MSVAICLNLAENNPKLSKNDEVGQVRAVLAQFLQSVTIPEVRVCLKQAHTAITNLFARTTEQESEASVSEDEEPMNMMEAIRLALAELGNVKSEELAAFVKERYGVTVGTKFVPVIKATLRDKERIAAARQSRTAEATSKTAASATTPAA